MRSAIAAIFAFVGGVCWGENPREALFSTTNHWGRSVPTYRARAMESAHALMAIGDSEAMRTWYQELSQYPEFQDGSRNSTWRDTKTSLMMFFARTADIRVSTNCWFATADLLGKYNAVLRQCETDLAELSSFDSTNATADLVVQRLNAYRDKMNRALSYQRSVPLLSEAVTNVFPRYAMPIIPECWRAEVWSNVLHRAGLR